MFVKEKRTYQGMKSRCLNKNDLSYPDYGGRGIKISKRWLRGFKYFLQDMGPSPSKGHSIDRINVNKGYFPSNCRWATSKEQANNTRRSRMLTYNGETKSMLDWSIEYKMSYFLLRKRLYDGYDLGAALSYPPGKIKKQDLPRKKRGNGASKYIGVHIRVNGRWQAVYSRKGNGERVSIGYFDSEKKAAKAFILYFKNRFGYAPYKL